MEYKQFQDSELLSLLYLGDALAFKEIYTRYWKELFMHACHKVGDSEMAQELLQNIFLSIWEKRQGLNILNLKAYLYGALRFSIIGVYKTQLVHDRFLAHSVFETESRSPDEELGTLELKRAIDQGIAMLPAKSREVFTLSRMDHHSTREIAGLLKLSEKAVEYHITRSIKALRVHLKEHLLCVVLLSLFVLTGI